jgi:small nuclear ribonucleoprotein (snRNP)-like protein
VSHFCVALGTALQEYNKVRVLKEKQDMTEQIEKLFGETVRIKVADSRIIEGQLQAIDKDMNIGTSVLARIKDGINNGIVL